MDRKVDWLKKMHRLKRYQGEHGKAPHKPLLLLVLLDLAEAGELNDQELELTPQLAYRFSVYASIIVHRWPQPVTIRYPFFHLHSDGFWTPLDNLKNQTGDRERARFALIQSGFYETLRDQEFRMRARHLLISTYFNADERAALYALANMEVPDEDQIGKEIDLPAILDAEKKGREARFRVCVLYAYGFMCSLTRYRLSTVDNESIVDAAHIHQFSDSGNNDPRNGLALCKNAHWLFDRGLWTLNDDYKVFVARSYIDEESLDPGTKKLADYHGQRIHLPKNESAWPDPQYIKWHRDNRFKGDKDAVA